MCLGIALKENMFEDQLIRELIRLRNLLHDQESKYTYGPEDGKKMEYCVDILLNSCYKIA